MCGRELLGEDMRRSAHAGRSAPDIRLISRDLTTKSKATERVTCRAVCSSSIEVVHNAVG